MNSHFDPTSRLPNRTWLFRATAAALVAAAAFVASPYASAEVSISVRIAPPPLPVYEQPEIPGEGYIWTPGYWAWDGDINDYYWVPGTWVQPPTVGVLWTPGYWGWGENVYVFHPGYWGPHIGYYGGINYGYGYVGVGYEGGYWRNGGFYYNTAVNRFGGGVHITNVYNRTVVNVTVNRFSFNGPGGVDHRPDRNELTAEHERHIPPPAAQIQHVEAARHEPTLRASVNHGAPPIAATARPADLKGPEATHAQEADAKEPANPSEKGSPREDASMKSDANAQKPETPKENPRPAVRNPSAPPMNDKASPMNPERNRAPRPESAVPQEGQRQVQDRTQHPAPRPEQQPRQPKPEPMQEPKQGPKQEPKQGPKPEPKKDDKSSNNEDHHDGG